MRSWSVNMATKPAARWAAERVRPKWATGPGGAPSDERYSFHLFINSKYFPVKALSLRAHYRDVEKIAPGTAQNQRTIHVIHQSVIPVHLYRRGFRCDRLHLLGEPA